MEEEEAERQKALEIEARRVAYEQELLASTARGATVRTPPSSFGTPHGTPYVAISTHQHQQVAPIAAKRILSSPDTEQSDATRRKTEQQELQRPLSTSAPPTTPCTPEPCNMSLASAMELTELAITATGGIMDAVRAKSSKLNKDEIAAIGGHVNSVSSVVTVLIARLAAAETRAAVAEEKAKHAQPAAAAAPVAQQPEATYASKLRLPRGKPEIELQPRGPTVLFYPNSETIKSSEDTRKELQKAIKPGIHGVQCQRVSAVSNAGVAVQTRSVEAARKLKEAAPPTLKVTDPKSRKPLVAIRNLRSDPKAEDLLEDLHRINLADDQNWPKEKLLQQCRVAFKKGRRDSNRTTVVLECTGQLRDKLVSLHRVYIGWDEAEICDYIRLTCCSKCQQYGHPEKHCRAANQVCGKCGENGHKAPECKSETQCCATCKRFKRPNKDGHLTAALTCPARQFAEQQAANMTQYG